MPTIAWDTLVRALRLTGTILVWLAEALDRRGRKAVKAAEAEETTLTPPE